MKVRLEKSVKEIIEERMKVRKDKRILEIIERKKIIGRLEEEKEFI